MKIESDSLAFFLTDINIYFIKRDQTNKHLLSISKNLILNIIYRYGFFETNDSLIGMKR